MPIRRNYLIKKGLQLRYLGLILFGMVSAAIVTGLFIYLQLFSSVTYEFSEARLAQRAERAQRMGEYEAARLKSCMETPSELSKGTKLLSDYEKALIMNILRRANVGLIPSVAVLLLIISTGALLISHRVAGPLYRMQKLAADVKEGDLTVRFKLRRDDELKEVAAAFDNMVRALEGAIFEASALAVEIRQACLAGKEGLPAGRQAAGGALSEPQRREMIEKLARLNELLSHFKAGSASA